jgi:hypothetical protein
LGGLPIQSLEEICDDFQVERDDTASAARFPNAGQCLVAPHLSAALYLRGGKET